MLKKWLCLALAVCLLTVGLPLGAGVAAYSDVPANADYREAVEVLTALGALTDSGEFRPDEEMTRAAFVDMLVQLIAPDFIPAETDVFRDVEPDHPYYRSVMTAEQHGLISGYGRRIFRPDELITPAEAVSIVIRLLGYWQQAENMGGFPSGYLARAANLGVLKGLTLGQTLSKSQAAVMLYNMLEIDIAQLKGIGEQADFVIVPGENVLTKFLECDVISGVIQANAFTGLASVDAKTPRGQVLITDSRGTSVLAYVGETDAASLLGYGVKAYYQEDAEGDYQLLYVSQARTNVLEIDSKDLIDVQSGRITYFQEDGRSTFATLLTSVDIIFNGIAYPDYDLSRLLEADGKLTLVDNNNTGYGVAFVQEYQTFVLSVLDTGDRVIYGKYTPYTAFAYGEMEDKDGLVIRDIEGREMRLNSLMANQVLTIMPSQDGTYVEIIVSSQKITGTMDAVALDEDKMWLDGIQHTVAPSFLEEAGKIAVGYTGTFLLDFAGRIAGKLGTTNDTTQYGYIKQVAQMGGIDNEIKLKLMTTDGAMVEMDVADKLELDGVKGKTPEDLYALLTVTEGSGSYTNMQVVRFKTNAKNEINYVDTANLTSSEDPVTSLRKMDVSTSADGESWRSGAGIFGSRVIANTETVVFFVPTAGPGNDQISDEKFLVRTNSSFIHNQRYANLVAYDVSDGGIASIIVWPNTTLEEGSDIPSTDALCSMVDSVTMAVNSEGEEVPRLYFMEDGALKSLFVDSVNTVQKPVYDNNWEIVPGQYIQLERGDVIRYATNAQGEISGISVDMDIRRVKNPDNMDLSVFTNTTRNEVGLVYAMVYSQGGGGVRVTSTYKRDSLPALEFETDEANLYTYVAGSVNICVYDRERDKVEWGSVNDIRDFKTYGSDASFMLIHCKWSDIRDCFIYK